MKRHKLLIRWVLGLATSGTVLQFAHCGPDVSGLIMNAGSQLALLAVGGFVDALSFAITQGLGGGQSETAATDTAATDTTTSDTTTAASSS